MSEYICELEDARYEMTWAPKEKIVRCKDCKYHESMIVSYLNRPLSVCTAWWCEGAEGNNLLVKPDGYCAWGERKERIER